MPEQVGNYVLLEVIGSGPHGTVHRARQRDRGRIVAVKRLRAGVPAEAVARVRADADVLAALEHPGIVELLDVVDDPDGGLALAMTYVPGGSLADVLRGGGTWAWPQVADLGAQVASALAAAHAAGVLHGNLRPADVLLDVEDEPRLAGFGMAWLGVDTGGEPSVRSDLHDLGVVLHRVMGDHAEVPGALTEAIGRAMARDPEGFESASQLQAALAPVAAWGRDLAASEPATPPRGAGDVPLVARPTAGRGASRTPRLAWLRPAAVAVPVAVLVVVLARWWALGPGDVESRRPTIAAQPAISRATPAAGAADDTGAAAEVTPRQPQPRCPDVPELDGPALLADVDGRGCTLPLQVSEEVVGGTSTVVLAVPEAAGSLAGRYALARAGGVVLVGDWDCDGSDTPAVHRPDDGQVFYYDGYGQLEASPGPTLAPGVEAAVVTEGTCDRVVAAGGSG